MEDKNFWAQKYYFNELPSMETIISNQILDELTGTMIKQALFVLACIAISSIRAQQPCLHAPQNPHSFAASPLFCAHYTICMGGNTIIGEDQVCPPGLFFNPQGQNCGETSCLECSPFGIQKLPHPDNCHQFVECVMGHREMRSCPNGLLFDRSVGQCNEAHAVICAGDPTTLPPSETTTTPWEATTSPWDTTTSPWVTTTNPWETTTSAWGTTPNPQLPVCLPGQVFHAHPSDCTKFYLCINMVLWSQTCPNQLHWNQRINTCDHAQYAGCLHNGGGTGQPPIPTEPTLFPPETTTWGPTETTTWSTTYTPTETTLCPPDVPPNPIRN